MGRSVFDQPVWELVTARACHAAAIELATCPLVAFLGNFVLIFSGLCSNAMSGTSCLSESAMAVCECIEGLSTLEFRRSV